MRRFPGSTTRKRRRFFAKGIGAVIIGFWLVMMGLLIFKNNLRRNTYPPAAHITRKEGPGTNKTDPEWMEIFLHDKKIGYSRSRVQPLEGGYVVHEELYMQLNLLGRANLIRSETHALVDQQFHLKNFNFHLQSGATSFSVNGEIKDNWLIITRKGNPAKKLRLREPLYISSSLNYLLKSEPLAVGKSFRIPFFDPSTLARKIMVVRVTERETITIHGIAYPAYRLETTIMGQHLSFWLDKHGNVLKENGLMGMMLVRSNPAQATRGIASNGAEDFYELASVESDRRLPRPRQMKYLEVKLAGIDRTPFDVAALRGNRQEYRQEVLKIRSETVPRSGPYSLPYEDRSAAMGAYLNPEINVEADDPAIQRKAGEIIGKTHDPVAAARRLMTWVYVKLDKRPVLAVPSAREVLKTLVGDCNEHAVLLTAFLRAVGIPARVCAGLVYARGKFYYHAWTEAYVGRWVSMDATLNQMPTDATHITLVRGNLENQTAIIALMGKLKIKVLDYDNN